MRARRESDEIHSEPSVLPLRCMAGNSLLGPRVDTIAQEMGYSYISISSLPGSKRGDWLAALREALTERKRGREGTTNGTHPSSDYEDNRGVQ